MAAAVVMAVAAAREEARQREEAARLQVVQQLQAERARADELQAKLDARERLIVEHERRAGARESDVAASIAAMARGARDGRG